MDGQQQQPGFRAVYFQVTDGAQAEMQGGAPMLYVGVSYHIPRAEIEEAQRVFEETHDPERAQQVVAKDDVDPQALIQRVTAGGFMPMPDAILERFDTVDSETGDILVLLRVPCIAGSMVLGTDTDLPEAA